LSVNTILESLWIAANINMGYIGKDS